MAVLYFERGLEPTNFPILARHVRHKRAPAPPPLMRSAGGRAVDRCQRHVRNVAGEEKHMAEVRITASKNGPYIVSGPVELTDADGKTWPARPRMALCRCGGSTTKPFCDGTHSKIGFQAAEEAVAASQ
jgi:3-phenylpropionate/trans-cinnamate dioxygenase ferredoxin subunit